jgi:hypothetical protein
MSRSLTDVIAALASAFGAFDVDHVELARDIAEDEIRSEAFRVRLTLFPGLRKSPGQGPPGLRG